VLTRALTAIGSPKPTGWPVPALLCSYNFRTPGRVPTCTHASFWCGTKLSLFTAAIPLDPFYLPSLATSSPSTWHQGIVMDRFIEKFERDRRLSRRYNLKTPLRVRVRRSDLAERKIESQNLSQRGVFFATDLPLTEGAALDLLVEMPQEVTGIPPAQWLCMGHVVRVVPVDSPPGSHGVGVQFDFYEVSRSERPHWSMGVGLRGPSTPLIDG
jgi:PilZ domain